MAIDWITMAAVGILAFCIVFAANHLSKRRLPKWLMPAAIGGSMIAYSVWNEYSWFERVRADLPASVVILAEVQGGAPWRPWSYAFPVTSRFIALDRAAVLRSAASPDLVATDVLLVTRWGQTVRVPVAFDCKAGARADLVEGAELVPDGTLRGATWMAVGLDDEMLKAACNGG
ncbi:hypothetical protein [Phaeovulum sp.]|uniref:hypothetical protein n=1 Tax=Phaeovulum sp. TaxID=2934796 RepID=UPI00272FE207|nr:hypothetical protein [Phaeovulum sp.]MDP1667951.1 hypothetical protein [Phaeovulum sp.]MDZ4119401.1 hypothetical protein [Phaeovulum sp.]